MTSIFGPLIAPWNVEQAVLSTVHTWIGTYLAELERQNNLKVGDLPRPASFNGGLDFLSFQQDETPAVITTCEPFGEPELIGSGEYNQWYAIELGCVLITGSEHDAREAAGLYAAALAGIGVQPHSCTWGGIAGRTRLVGAPVVKFVDPDIRTVVLGSVSFHSFIQAVVSEAAGPDAPTPPGSSQYPGSPDVPWTPWPTVSTVSVAVSGEPITGLIP